MGRLEEIRAWAAQQHPDDGEIEPPELLEDVIFLLSIIDRIPALERVFDEAEDERLLALAEIGRLQARLAEQQKVIEAARVVAGTRSDSQSAENLKALRSALDALGEPSHAH